MAMIDNRFTRLLLITLLPLLFVACGGGAKNNGDSGIPGAATEALADPKAQAPEPADVLCLAHRVSASECFICDAALRDPGRLWCREHARYEDRCFECHPELREANRLYCEEHGLYEDECFLCHPEPKIEQSSADPPETGLDLAGTHGLFCGEHQVPEVECGICQPALADKLQPGQGLKIRLPSMASESKTNIVAKEPQAGPAGSSVHAVGELRFNLNRLARITPLTEGIVRGVYVDLGQEVKRGQVVAELSSAEIAEAKAELLRVVAEESVASELLSREHDLFEQELIAAQRLRDVEARHTMARASLRAAEQRLLDLGFDRQHLERVIIEQEASSLLRLVAPFGGTVIERDAVVGNVVAMGDPMFSVADLSTMWVSLAVSERDVGRLRLGQRVEIRSQALDRDITGEITWISNQIKETTRMAEVRAEVANPDRSLRAGMFVDATIVVDKGTASLLVPRDTVHHFGGNPFVFVRLSGDLYELRRVETAPAARNLTAVTAGLNERDRVAVDRSYLLKSEFQKSRLGAGCVD
jgi:cobalt-zinc-cadmium efflux system membrane fusion protein